ncbi:very short patch repair endonuclease [Crenobacter cavernae]|uniref:Very short patch repair endonuclease n=1 Tax=Crenobacter cavernae TaxID=2290923 RepID=A0A345Y3K9_9NEIS|nr:DNA mismatch endonuclease Vsr [Crenobacter cavernae]AXK38511.1 DNA mismatch endonuclease Vsr [Crenobacter cavernae]
MVDTVTKETRSRIMARVRNKDTGPEMIVRRLVFSMRFRYRLHVGRLPGRPDLVFPGRRKVIFIHGCFWHRHEGCAQARIPKSRVEFWTAKLTANSDRDKRNIAALQELGWEVLVLWECELADSARLRQRISDFLGPAHTRGAGGLETRL